MKNTFRPPAPARAFSFFCTVCYALLSMALIAIALTLVASSLWQAWEAYRPEGKGASEMLDAIGLLVISMAVLDSGKYLMEEEVLRDRELRSAVEARRTLTKFMVIITIAVSLETVVSISRVGHDAIGNLIYPAALLLSAVAIILGLGVYQKLSRSGEEKNDRS